MSENNRFHYAGTYKVSASNVNIDGKLSISGILDLFQSYATAHSDMLGTGGDVFKEKYNAFWVVTKHKFHVYTPPKNLDDLSVETWILPGGKVAVDRCYRFTDQNGEVAVEGRSEWVVLDLDRHSVRRLSTTSHSTEGNTITDITLPERFSNLKYEIDSRDYVYSHTVMASDIDMSAHTNNVMYVRIMQNAFDCNFYLTHDITDFEIQYRRESVEGNVIDLYRKDGDGRSLLVTASPDGVIYAIAELKYKNRN